MTRFQHRVCAVVFSACVLIGVPIVAVASASCSFSFGVGSGGEEVKVLVLVGEEKTLEINNPTEADGKITSEEVSDKEVLELTGKSCVGELKKETKCLTQKFKCKKVGTAKWIVKGDPGGLSRELTIECHEKKGDFLALLESWGALTAVSWL